MHSSWSKRLTEKEKEAFPGLSLWRLRGKAQSILFGMIIMMMLLIVYRVAANSKESIKMIKAETDNSQEALNIKRKVENLENINELMPMTQSSNHINKQREIESKILADVGDHLAVDHGYEFAADERPIESPHKLLNSESKEKDDLSDKSNEPIFKGHRIVHLDLKGAPPKLSYYEEIFPLIKNLGGTGLLIEYEDMFPYRHVELTARNAYSKEDIARILKMAADNQLIVIPLLQTFGHLEFILKLKKYKHLREAPSYPQVVCPSNNGTLSLIKEMIDDIIELHPTSEYIHIGCDEVYNLGECPRCSDMMVRERWTKKDLFLHHVTTVARYIKERHLGFTVLTWDDEFRQLSVEELMESGVGQLLEPVVWKYTPDMSTDISFIISRKYSAIFQSVWIASAFKGATGPDMYVTDIGYHFYNHRFWMQLVSTYSNTIHFKGIFLTGWQRYDHFAVLCELLPVGIPSLAVNLVYITSNKPVETSFGSRPPDKVISLLRCENGEGLMKLGSLVHCTFPGSQVFDAALRLYSLNEDFQHMTEESAFKGWFSEYNIQMMFSSKAHVEEATSELDRMKMELTYIERDITNAMGDIYDISVITEWISTYIKPLHLKILKLWEAKEKLLSKDDWPRRPLTPLENKVANKLSLGNSL